MNKVWISPPDPPRYGVDRRNKNRSGFTGAQRKRKCREKITAMRQRCIAVLDMETDPFETDKIVHPFLAVLYSDQFEPVIIWEENHDRFVDAVFDTITALPDQYTIYAHNGGKFDFMFLVHKLRGSVKFKGRGIMCAHIGAHQLRDSFHIIPERLAAFQKDSFDYRMLENGKRNNHRSEITRYCLNDCRYLFDIVKKFVADFGLKISIGQAAMYRLRQDYTVPTIGAGFDKMLRQFYFGGRVECFNGSGKFQGPLKLIDTNSMYPYVMCAYVHPIGGFHDYTFDKTVPNDDTAFVHLICNNHGALISRLENGEVSANKKRGEFFTTIHEYRVALQHGLISDISVLACYDCKQRTNFSKFVLPLYNNRLLTKKRLDELKKAQLESTAEFIDVKKDDIFYKLLLNNAYGKFAQDPRRYKEHYITDPDESPPDEWMSSIYELGFPEAYDYIQPTFESEQYWVWCKPNPGFRFNNVGVAASITGAARAVLLDAKQKCIDPIYCDTDSIICRGWRSDLWIDKVALGAWDLEAEFSEVIILGKKLYSVRYSEAVDDFGQPADYKVKSKGTAGLSWAHMEMMLAGHSTEMVNVGPTLTKTGKQYYLRRNIRATAFSGVQEPT